NIVSLYRQKEKIAEIEIEFEGHSGLPTIELQNGQTHPNYQGFEFLKMEEPIESPTLVVKFYNDSSKVKMKSEIRLSDFKVNTPIVPQELSYGSRNIKYTLYEPLEETKRFFVVFSTMIPKYDYKYNYYQTLKDINAYQLYIKDDVGEFGNYYVANNKNPEIQTEVISLIYNLIRKYNIALRDVTLIG